MPVSKECLNLLDQLIKDYSNSDASSDPSYNTLSPKLTEWRNLIRQDPRAHKDERIISWLSTSALMAINNPRFVRACRQFIISYQEQTKTLDTLMTDTVTINPDLSSWGGHDPAPVPAKDPTMSGRFFMELQAAFAERKRRLGIDEEHLNEFTS